jgi:hypothetical protein
VPAIAKAGAIDGAGVTWSVIAHFSSFGVLVATNQAS